MFFVYYYGQPKLAAGVAGARGTGLVMWLPLLVSRWQKALREKSRSVRASCDVLKGRDAQLRFKDEAVASMSRPVWVFLGWNPEPNLLHRAVREYRLQMTRLHFRNKAWILICARCRCTEALFFMGCRWLVSRLDFPQKKATCPHGCW